MIIKPTTDKSLPWVDYSSLTAVNTCIRWGLIHSIHGKQLPSGVDRVLPLEAGRAMHDVFACCRFFDMLNVCADEKKAEEVNAYATKLFASAAEPNRWNQAMTCFASAEDDETRCMQMCLNLLETSGYHDDPRDSKRTQSNLESAAINYVQRYPLGRFVPIHTADGIIGVEVPFDVTMYSDANLPIIRFVGRVDGVCNDTLRPGKTIPEVHENKTGSRIDTVWSNSFETSHQVTGYCVAMSCILNEPIRNCTMWGLQIPVPKSSMYSDGIMRYPVSRTDEQLYEWQLWVLHTVRMINNYMEDPVTAPMYTHSCNRYFRSCSLIPFCTESEAQRRHIFNNEMVTKRWSPLEEILDP